MTKNDKESLIMSVKIWMSGLKEKSDLHVLLVEEKKMRTHEV